MLKSTLEQWRMFKAVVDAGGFNQAAALVHKSQSSVHHAVQKLENAIGVVLFENSGRKVKLSPQGELMYRRAAFVLNEAQKLEAVAASLQAGTETLLRIAVDIIFPSDLLYNVLSKVSEEFPLLRIEIEETVLSGANSLLDSGNVDIAISPFPYPGGFSEDLCEIDFAAVAHVNHPLHALDRALTLEDLKSHRQIVVRDSSAERKVDAGWLGADQRWTVSHIRTSVDMISQGLGFAWIPIAIIKKELEEGLLLPLPIDSNSGLRRAMLYLTFEDGDGLGPAARSFIGELRYQSMQLPSADGMLDQCTESLHR
ncbi:LysR family transcriptional regulator [Alteromonas stellipolaris]|jgi:DNA-binding transcriptional LysR family regulator|uniref:LysR family transcriptional regulator n=1 Tax=Alteromonas stellipolaris TaxID=233316 RepID=A0ABM5YJX5_9ALTE|nr:LysR family transcriptional regulator [Alteromonas stellipolaris]ALM90236.1 Transcriptional regulator, LysR [Alteromonas stellipolaris LMG 21856]AMJ74743.1 LysR family transcriptional regulator [Alteromonas stellipolaris]MDO6534466.1 LysR family transcriptional regulator [Alteromonas stellipolaris]MDO6626343.1 LysR family transcriptional regulator [Alteromonas stellipolaris]MDP2536207.1 LysR family transcriptional regulator [Alteromonas stellipolaris]